MPEEEGDADEKLFTIEQRKSQFEKRLFWVLIIAMALLWVFVLQDVLIEHGKSNWSWSWAVPP